VTLPTGESADTLQRINVILDTWVTRWGQPSALGIASFGPLDLRPESPRFGRITSTVKRGWKDADIAGIGHARGVPVSINTDVNGAALAEGRWGAARGLTDYAYVTVGTGVGVGLIVGGRPVFGCNHTEFGHIRVARLAGDSWPGACPYHGDCVEGLASGPAIAARTGLQGHEIGADNPVWEPVADALGQLMHAMLAATAPRRILVAGGVVEHHPELLAKIRQAFVNSVNGYLDLEDLTGGADRYVVPPGLGALAGPLGALALAADLVGSPLPL
jgi:fructokinase